jgi:hypothetical protein
MIRIYLISMLAATLIAGIICLCISLSKPKESFIGDDPPTSGDVLLADNQGSLTTYPLQNLISYIKSSVTNLSAQLTHTQSDLASFKDTITKTVSDNLADSKTYTDQRHDALNADLTKGLADLDKNKQAAGDYLLASEPVAIRSKVNDDPNRPTSYPLNETWLANGAGAKYQQGTKTYNPALLSLEEPKNTHTYDRTWSIIPWKHVV